MMPVPGSRRSPSISASSSDRLPPSFPAPYNDALAGDMNTATAGLAVLDSTGDGDVESEIFF
jgi:hypothetical protein